MAGLTGKSIASAYKSILRVDDDANGIDATAESITDGEGTKSALRLSDDVLAIRPTNDNGTDTFTALTKGGQTLLAVDTTNNLVKAGVGQFNVLTQYAYFGVGAAGITSANTAGYHYPLFFGGPNGYSAVAASSDQLNIFGNGTDPATSFTTAEGSGTRGSELVPHIWLIQDNIAIDEVIAIEGADTATGDTTRMHLMSYTFNSGSTTALSGGSLLAYNSDITNAGSEQAYRSTFTISDSDVDGGKVILAFLRSDSINSDYSVNMYIKYHLR